MGEGQVEVGLQLKGRRGRGGGGQIEGGGGAGQAEERRQGGKIVRQGAKV